MLQPFVLISYNGFLLAGTIISEIDIEQNLGVFITSFISSSIYSDIRAVISEYISYYFESPLSVITLFTKGYPSEEPVKMSPGSG